MNVVCQYCNKPAALVDSSVIYGSSYGMIYLCGDCNAYVGVHKGTERPLGTLANEETREWRRRAHKVFDPLWRQNVFTSRRTAYRWLAKALGVREVHIGASDIETCRKIIQACEDKITSRPNPPVV